MFVFEVRWLLQGLHGGTTLDAAVIPILDHTGFFTPEHRVNLPVVFAAWIFDTYDLNHIYTIYSNK